MRPAYFGSSSRPLFGIHEPARASAARDEAVLLCYPGVQEYSTAHWAFRRLSVMAARDGLHVLRFDWSGTGDSWGDTSDGNAETWLDDVELAVRELRDASGANTVSIVGMRLGAAIAALACAERVAVHKLVLWEPVVTGRSYIAELEALDAKENVRLLHHVPRGHRNRDELVGFRFGADLRASLERIDLCRNLPRRADRVAVVADSERSDHRRLLGELNRSGVTVTFDCVPEGPTSNRERQHDSALLAARSLVAITDRLSGRVPS